jgi:hypothetical protein
MKAAAAPFHEAERAHAINERASENATIEWKSKISGLEGLRYEVEKILNSPHLHRFSMPRLSRSFWVHGLDPHQYLETASHLYTQLSELRNEVNKHALQTGAITGIRSVRKMRQLMMELDAAAKYLEKLESEFRASSIRFKHVSDAYNESRSNLIHELRKIGTAGEIGLLRLYEKLTAAQKSSDDQPEIAVENVRLVADATCT